MNIVVFTANPPTKKQSGIITSLIDLHLDPMVDSVHYWKDWFLQQFSTISHRVYYTDPFLLTGKITDINFDISGNPEFAVYTTDGGELSDDEWTDVTNWLDAKLADPEAIVKECRLKPASNPTLLSELPTITPDILVKQIDAKEYFYSFEYKHMAELDMMMYSVHKPLEEEPYTVIVDKFSQHGHTHFFTDIFSNVGWGKDVLNFNFLTKVWGELKMDGELTGERLNNLLAVRTEEFLPKDGLCSIEPQVYRKSFDDLLKEKASFGIKL